MFFGIRFRSSYLHKSMIFNPPRRLETEVQDPEASEAAKRPIQACFEHLGGTKKNNGKKGINYRFAYDSCGPQWIGWSLKIFEGRRGGGRVGPTNLNMGGIPLTTKKKSGQYYAALSAGNFFWDRIKSSLKIFVWKIFWSLATRL